MLYSDADNLKFVNGALTIDEDPNEDPNIEDVPGPLNDGGFAHITEQELTDIEGRLHASSRGPWKACKDGHGSCCTTVWSGPDDHPVAEFTTGEWGDEYPDLRIVGGSLDHKVEAFMNRIGYGTVPRATTTANIQFVINAHRDIRILLAEIRELRDRIGLSAPSGQSPLATP